MGSWAEALLTYARSHIGYLVSALVGGAGGALATFYRESIAKLFQLMKNLIFRACVRLGWYPVVLRRYKKSIVAKFSRIRMGYRDFEIDVSKHYIKLKLMPGFIPPAQRERDELPRSTMDVADVLKAKDKGKPLRLVILGQPGSGKSTLLQHLSLVYATEGPKPTKKKLIPILLWLREARETSLWDFLISSFATHKFPSAKQFLIGKLQKGECILLLDGLDELVEADQRRIAGEIRNLAILYDKNTFILTSRIEGYVRASEILFEEAEIAPLDPLDKETASFVSGILEPSDRPARFLETLRSDENLKRLAESPLLLSLVLFIYKESKGQLPRNRTKIYKTFIQWMLRDRDETRGIYQYRNKFDAEDKELFLRKVAYSFFMEGSKEFTRNALLAKTYDLAQHLNLERGREAKFLDEIVQYNGLLRHTHGDQFSFVHLTFQEYYVAKEIKEANRMDEVYAHIADPTWSEIVLFLCGLADFHVTEKLIVFILDKTDDYIFAGRCLAHASSEMTAPSQRIVPELLHSGSPEAKRTLLEIGDNSVVASLCNILRDDSSTAGQVEFARDCLRGLNKQLISDYVLGSAKEWRTRDCFGKALAVLNVFRDFADEKLNASIAELQNLLEQKHHTALHQFRTHLSSCSFEEAGAALRSFEHTEGTAPDFVDLLRVREKLERSWNSLTLLVHDASGSEEEQLKQIQKTSEEIESLCQQLGVDVNSLKEKLVSICGRWLEKESDYSRKRRWVQRMNAVAPWKTESLKRFLGW